MTCIHKDGTPQVQAMKEELMSDSSMIPKEDLFASRFSSWALIILASFFGGGISVGRQGWNFIALLTESSKMEMSEMLSEIASGSFFSDSLRFSSHSPAGDAHSWPHREA